MCNDIKDASVHEVRQVFATAGEELESQLSFIRRHEIRINKSNEAAINQLG